MKVGHLTPGKAKNRATARLFNAAQGDMSNFKSKSYYFFITKFKSFVMNTKDQFYIGWQEKIPVAYAKYVKTFVWVAALLFIAGVFIVVFAQKGFRDSVFELGKLSQVEGVLVKQPVPMLKVQNGSKMESVLLIGFGKFGAEKDIAAIEAQQGDLTNQQLTLEGTLIYHKGKTILELTKGPTTGYCSTRIRKRIFLLLNHTGCWPTYPCVSNKLVSQVLKWAKIESFFYHYSTPSKRVSLTIKMYCSIVSFSKQLPC